MRFLRVGEIGRELPAVEVVEGDRTVVRDLRPVTADIDGPFLASGPVDRVRAALADGMLPERDITGQRLGAPIARPGTIVCIGLNYRDHAAETGAAIPAEPVVFMKAPNTMVGPHDDVLVPRGSTKTDWEVELGVVIGRRARYLGSREEAAGVIAGYATSHDVSEREFQLERGGQWDKGKSCETFNPFGPYLVPAEEVADPQDLRMTLSVNGVTRQNGTTATMIFDVLECVRYLSQFMVLEPGDVVNTGTPAGVALGLPDTPYLRAGDVVELEIEGLGAQRQRLVQA
ncbi:fumarylacetoacetate hydrolase family protein [Georgenia phoenicis]|uniref:fumarylacetoacetate hydrolase family protein n=1 Tax=unclassified Georgenia TaxID=2626815 RepID=UPI0039AEB9F2